MAALAGPLAVVMVVISGLSLSKAVSPNEKLGSRRERLRKIDLNIRRFPFVDACILAMRF